MRHDRNRNTDQDDAALVASVLTGEREAFDLLLQRYSSSVLRLCIRLLGNAVEAQDIAQEAALQAFLGLTDLREPSRFAAWFHAIAVNLARSALRRRHEHSLEALGEETMTRLLWIEPPLSIEECQIEREIHEAILLALQDLAPGHRQAVIGFYLQGYSYEELAKLLGIPVSTVKWRLFQGRKLLKTLLQPVVETLQHPLGTQRKEQHMPPSDLIELEMYSMCTLPITRQHAVILIDREHPERGIPVLLTAAEADTLGMALQTRKSKDPFPLLQDFSQRLLESLDAHLQRVVINALAGQTLYATMTIRQGQRTREIDQRLSEALALATRLRVSLLMTRSLFETAATLDLTVPASASSSQETLAGTKEMQNLGREQRLQLEEEVRGSMAALIHQEPEPFSHRLWAFLLECLTGKREDVSAARLRSLDLAAALPAREVTWDEQPMTAICLPDQAERPGQSETAWLLVRPQFWKPLTNPKLWQVLRPPEPSEEPIPFADGFPPQIQQRVEASLAHLVDFPQVRTAFLLHPQGTVSAWKGPDTQETLQKYSRQFSQEFSLQASLDHQLGCQPRPGTVIRSDTTSPPKELEESDGVVIKSVGNTEKHYMGWHLVVILAKNALQSFDNPRKAKGMLVQHIDQVKSELSEVLTSSVSNGGHSIMQKEVNEGRNE